MPVASRQSADVPLLYRDSTGIHRGVAVALPGSVWAPLELRCRPGCSRCGPGCSRSSRRYSTFEYFPVGAPVFPSSSRSSPVHPGRAPVHTGRSLITHWGSDGIIVRLGLYPDKEQCTDGARCLT
ncbi:hypothetical protein DPMN_016751 [Dreissena polymorpha]|uniref:Uncharacterized protein n=1 Tax=Dreissena polymorpha TaxID=45954 RepID=A0A9D4NF69_DREPO|nr:hypothetical protein DPMN_016751 [Dreissena polymorpha]